MLRLTGQHWAVVSSFLFSIVVFPLDYAGPFSVVPFCLCLFFPDPPYLLLLSLSASNVEAHLRPRSDSGGAVSRDFPDGLMPTTAVGLLDDSITILEISKHLTGSMEGVSTRFRGAMRSETPFLRAFERGSGRPVPLPPHPPAVSSGSTIIPAPVPVVGAAEYVPGWPGRAIGVRRPPPSGRSRTVNA